MGRVATAVAIMGFAIGGLATGTAAAAPGCADYHFIGAAGSGQRDGAGLTANGGMGDVVYATYRQLSADVAARGETMTAEAVQYPAAPVPLDEGGLGEWLSFKNSVIAGTDAVAQQYRAYTAQCPTSKVVLAGYSQGAMVVHRNLYALAGDPQLAAALLVADGDRLPGDTTIDLGSTAGKPTAGKGVAQEHYILASTNTAPLPPAVGARTVSVCDVGDPVCDYNPDTTEMTPAEIAVHTSYAPRVQTWDAPLAGLLTSTPPATRPV
ncbi:cutinase family protein [Mycobacterium sp. MYCO198283]|uniref:cutinase family protein n=1 Tax=Mycobacterium sp. MYCO198283 TaxID=2883505 RepID=UPI001E5B9D79|nr:cutinase family protein [Mycobacterium sp. MYCO198283]MCG5434060.1 cutinase family protein [Mycobacterium sp. MYCO198283]